MHGIFYNEARLDLTIKPQTPLLIKSGQPTVIDPTLPDMQFVRTHRPDTGEEITYIPGSSLRGVLRSYAERLVRSLKEGAACKITEKACVAGKSVDKMSGSEVYKASCYACRLFGNTGLAARVRLGDFYPNGSPQTEVRYGVAIDRVTGAVAHGPFQLEIVTSGEFRGTITIRNFTLGQLGLIAASLLDMADGLVPIGHGKSRGLGRVRILFPKVAFRYLQNPGRRLLGIEALVNNQIHQDYMLPPKENAWVEMEQKAELKGAFFVVEAEGDRASKLLEGTVSRWGGEVDQWREG